MNSATEMSSRSPISLLLAWVMQVERVVGRLTWPKVIGGGAIYGVWMGLFLGLILGLFQEDWIQPADCGYRHGRDIWHRDGCRALRDAKRET